MTTEDDKNMFKNAKILIVDDVVKNLEVVGSILKNYECSILAASSGKQALSLAIAKKPDLILLDIQMPEMDGYTVCHQLKNFEETKDIPIIFLTAKNDPEDIVKGFEAGGIDYVTKPFNPRELISRTFSHLELKLAKDSIKSRNQELQNLQVEIAREAQELILLNEELTDAQTKLKELNGAKDKLISIIAHDLKNAVQSNLLSSENLSLYGDKYSPEALNSAHKDIYNSTLRLKSLLENLLNWAKAQMGGIVYYPENQNLSIVVDKIISSMESDLKTKEIQVEKLYPDSVFAHFDIYLVSTILRNLLSNAIKFSPKLSTIKCAIIENKDNFELCVIDQGVGIEKENIEKLFRIDQKFKTQGTNGELGAGLGLTLCKDFAKLNKGDLFVKSEVGKGSEFSLTIPKNFK